MSNIVNSICTAKGAGSYSGQGGGANCAKGASRAPEANRGQRGESRAAGAKHVKKAFCSVIIIFVNISTIKT